MNFVKQSTLRFELYGSAAAAALFGVATCYDASPGLNWALWTAMVAGELTMFARPRLGANRAAFNTTIATAIVLGSGAAVTTNGTELVLIFLTVALLLAVAARLASGYPAPLLGVYQLTVTPFAATVDAIRETGARLSAAIQSTFTPTGARVARGTAIAVPVVGIFTALLAGADPTLSSWMHTLSVALSDWSWLPRLVLFCVLGTLSLGSFGIAVDGLTVRGTRPPGSDGLTARATRPPDRDDVGDIARSGVLGDTERRIVVAAVDALFALFLLLQLVHQLPTGESYTEYVHKGFAQLTIVATLSVLLVARLHHGRPRVGVPWATLALLAEVELLVASALHRITVYQHTFGYTALRVWVTAYMLLIAALLVLLALEITRPRIVDAGRFVRRGSLLATTTLIILVYGNPDAWVAQLELARYHATGKLNVSSLTWLSADATPSLLRIADELPAACAAELRRSARHAVPQRHWYEWNARQARADRAQPTIPLSPTTPQDGCRIQPW